MAVVHHAYLIVIPEVVERPSVFLVDCENTPASILSLFENTEKRDTFISAINKDLPFNDDCDDGYDEAATKRYEEVSKYLIVPAPDVLHRYTIKQVISFEW
jgi:hypothetical protein